MIDFNNGMLAHSLTNIPDGEHWVILSTTAVHIPGDERSRTNPGHGYPERTENYITYGIYKDYAKFEETLLAQFALGRNVKGIHVVGTYSKEVTISLVKTFNDNKKCV